MGKTSLTKMAAHVVIGAAVWRESPVRYNRCRRLEKCHDGKQHILSALRSIVRPIVEL